MVSKMRYVSLALMAGAVLLGVFVYLSETREEGALSTFPFQFGLDIQGGAHLVYTADVSGIEEEREIRQRMDALRMLIEQRVAGVPGASEPLVQIERGGLLAAGEHRLIVELPGVTDIEQAIATIGETPVLEFMLVREGADFGEIDISLDEELSEGDNSIDLEAEQPEEDGEVADVDLDAEDEDEDGPYIRTGLDGSMLNDAQFQRDQRTGEPVVSLRFNREGRNLFADITREHTGRQLAILLDGGPISSPVIREPILGGEAIISGAMSVTDARDLARRLQAGALPVPIELVSTQTVGATLGQAVLEDGVRAGVVGLALVALFLLVWYRLPGLVAIFSLSIYLVVMLSVFKLVPVTLTAAGIAGFILSIGMAVDANILIFERMKEELRSGKRIREAIEEGFSRAWLSIRDGNISSLLTAVILYWFGTPLVQGFALVFFIGVLVSMLTAISVSRTFLLALSSEDEGGLLRRVFDSGLYASGKNESSVVNSKI